MVYINCASDFYRMLKITSHTALFSEERRIGDKKKSSGEENLRKYHGVSVELPLGFSFRILSSSLRRMGCKNLKGTWTVN